MNPVVHFEMPYENRERVVMFYQSAFGWKIELLGEEMGNYVVATTAEHDARPGAPAGAIGGGFFPKSASDPGAAVPSVVIAVDDLRACMAKVTDAGGKLVGEPMTIPGIGEYIAIVDTEGNRVGLLQATSA